MNSSKARGSIQRGVKLVNANERLWGGAGLGGKHSWNDHKYSVYGETSVNTSLENFGASFIVKGTTGFRLAF